ncbi:peptidoglycan-associated lipoprotein Pal [Prosthecomicrobium pneumaticum]|uniref:Peptidoglycan-associated lipoprotein n=1 Tax=Prosthecomicrobium pneumaticum TaxID=81895 RepID=A0A7W9CW47_9HYPH|nr:peptidoglycan-associated lipoprotein Pal [Prosthecomicrobium pneumaticum]MBB5752601.1 peptidoglycan-associated lipoprotein [Prosthecomicrobium pneumaticum]
MNAIRSVSQGGRYALLIAAALMLAACASKPGADAAGGLGGGALGAGGAATPGSAQDFVVNVGDRVFFETDQTEVSSAGRVTLDRQAQWLQQYPRYTVIVEGHADERGTREYNIGLGARRSSNVKNYLVSRGINPSRIRTISYGKERPVAVCNDISCWSQNRRAVTVLDNAGS